MSNGWLCALFGFLTIPAGGCGPRGTGPLEVRDGGAGASASGGGGGQGGSPDEGQCPAFPTDHAILGCVSPATVIQGDAQLTGLTVRRRVPASASYCEAPGFSYVATRTPDALPLDSLQAFELEDEAGQTVVVQLGVGLPQAQLLSAGEAVAIGVRAPLSNMSPREGYVGVEVEGEPIVFVTKLFTPAFAAFPEMGIVFDGRECGPECPSQERLLRVTVGSESAILSRGEGVALAGLVFQKAYATTRALAECGCKRDCLVDFMLGAYRPRKALLDGPEKFRRRPWWSRRRHGARRTVAIQIGRFATGGTASPCGASIVFRRGRVGRGARRVATRA